MRPCLALELQRRGLRAREGGKLQSSASWRRHSRSADMDREAAELSIARGVLGVPSSSAPRFVFFPTGVRAMACFRGRELFILTLTLTLTLTLILCRELPRA
jgi:hypothetical protein